MDEPRVQKEEVLRLRRGDLAEGQAQFLVSSRWWRQFAEHVQLEADGASFSALREAAPAPPQIDNSDLLADGPRGRDMGILRPNVVEGQDYEFLPERAWNYLHGMYGGGPPLQRTVVLRGTELVVERYPLIVTVEMLNERGAREPGAAATQRISRDLSVREALASLGPSGTELRLWAHRRADLVLADGEAMDASTLRGWQRVGIGDEEMVGELQLKDGQTLLAERRNFGEWEFGKAVRRAAGSAHWKDPATDELEVGDRVDFQDGGGQWLSASVVAVGSAGRDGEVQLCCPALASAEDAVTSSLAQMSLDDQAEIEEGPTTPWVKLSDGRMAKWHAHELAADDDKRLPFGATRDLRTGDKCEVQREGVWSSATVQQIDWVEMTVEVKTGQGSVSTVAIDGEDLAKPGSMIAAQPAPSPSRAGGGAGGGDRYALGPLPEVEELKGICGLSNLGNTCFMNSALQALSNTPSWRDFFISGQYEEDINVDNPLGYKGRLASEFGKLMKEIWCKSQSSVSPSTLKRAISDANAMFAGYQQHDSHELLSFLLDAIHEDLNRVKQKPATEAPEHDGMDKTDDEVAALAWDIHLKRNQSVVVDHFQGQLRSEAKCLECERVSIKFDEVMYLSVPLPQPTTKSQQVTVVRDVSTTNRTAVQTNVEVPLTGVVGDMR
eukprot:COSAG06_NODE_8579_length_2125_cov_1.394373_1_plen_666_part_10